MKLKAVTILERLYVLDMLRLNSCSYYEGCLVEYGCGKDGSAQLHGPTEGSSEVLWGKFGFGVF